MGADQTGEETGNGYQRSDQGAKHKSKPLSKICDIPEADMPVWFKNGVKAAMMAPTAMKKRPPEWAIQQTTPEVSL